MLYIRKGAETRYLIDIGRPSEHDVLYGNMTIVSWYIIYIDLIRVVLIIITGLNGMYRRTKLSGQLLSETIFQKTRDFCLKNSQEMNIY